MTMTFRRSRKNNDDDMDPEASPSRESTVPPHNRRERNEALAIMIGRLSALTKNTPSNTSSTALKIEISVGNHAKVDDESPTATASTATISTFESEQRLAMAGMRSPQFANVMLSPSFQLPSPTEESPRNSFQVTFSNRFSNVLERKEDATEGLQRLLDAIDEGSDECEQVEAVQGPIKLVESQISTTKEEETSLEETTQHETEDLAMAQTIEVPEEDCFPDENTESSQSDPFLAIRTGEIQISDRKGRPPPIPSPVSADHGNDFDETEDSLLDDQSVNSENTERTLESQISRYSITQEVLNSPKASTPGINSENAEENTPPTFSSHPTPRSIDSAASRISYLSVSEMNSPSNIVNQLLPNDVAFNGSRISMAGEIQEWGGYHHLESAMESDSFPFESPDGREKHFLSPKSFQPLNTNDDWDEGLDPGDFIRYGNEIAQGRPPSVSDRRKDCGRFKTWQMVNERLMESCAGDSIDWNELDPVLVDRFLDSQNFNIEGTSLFQPNARCERQKTLALTHIRLHHSSPDDLDWHEKELDLAKVDGNQLQVGEATPPMGVGEIVDYDKGITLRTIRLRSEIQKEGWENRLDKYCDETDTEPNFFDYHGNHHNSDALSDSRHPPSQASSVSKLSSNLTGALPRISYPDSGPVDFDEGYDKTYHEERQSAVSLHSGTVYLLWKQRGQSIGVYLRKFKNLHGIYVDSLDPNGLASRAAAASMTSEYRTKRRSPFSAFKRNTKSKRNAGSHILPPQKMQSVGRLTPGMKIEMINGQPCPNDLQACTNIIVQTGGWLNLIIS